MLVFTGKSDQLEQTFDQVGKSSDQLAEESHRASMRMAEGFDYASSQSSMLSGGIGDVGGALTAAFGEDSGIGKVGAEMERYGSIIMGVTGLMDLLLFATNNLKLATLAKSVADKGAAAAQWLLNAAQLASPVTWIVIAIAALIAIIILIATKTDWFQRLWKFAWSGIKKAAEAVWNWLKKVPGWIGDAFKKIANFITAPFRFAFNQVAKLWNNTIGRLSWTVPNWVPFIGGNSISVPNLPTFHTGGIVPGSPGTAVPIMALAGERIGSPGSSGGDQGAWVRVDAGQLGDTLLALLAPAVGRRGGSVTALGVKVVGGQVR